MMPPQYVFDRWGTWIASIDDAGRFLDCDGRPQGRRLLRDRGVYDGDGRYVGRIDVLGQYWSESGAFVGYLGPVVEQRPTAAGAGRAKA